MELTNQASTLVDFSSGVQENTLSSRIKEWIDTNMYYNDRHYVWQIGIATAENIVRVEALIRQDMLCKHWKYWRADSFKSAMIMIMELNHYPFIFKSSHNEYLGKGCYVFAYKTMISKKSFYYHTLHNQLHRI